MKTILIAAISVNGKIEEVSGQKSLDWTSEEDRRFFVSKTKEIGTVIVGRKTFDTIGKPLKNRRLIIMSRSEAAHTHPSPDSLSPVEYSNLPPEALLKKLEDENVASVAICGGGNIYTAFLAAGLVDEIFLTVEPYLFRGGMSLIFEGNYDSTKLELLDVSKLGTQTVLLHYRVIR